MIKREKIANYSDVLIRIVVGTIFLLDGLAKLTGEINFQSILAEQWIPFSKYLAPVIASTEIICSVMLIFGLFTYISATLIFIGLLFMILTLYMHTGGWNGIKYHLLLLVILLRYIGTNGFGSIINLFKKRSVSHLGN